MAPSPFSLQETLRLHGPLIVLLAFALLVLRAPFGVGFVAGLVCAMAFALHGLVAGVGVARAALPAPVARALLSIGTLIAVTGAGAPRWAFAPQLIEAGAFLVTTAAASIGAIVAFGRAPTLRDGP